MSDTVASLALAHLYETQGHIDDALDMYRRIYASHHPEAQTIRNAISRLEAQQSGTADSTATSGLNAPDQDASRDSDHSDAGMAHLLEVWIKLIVMQKRVEVSRTIKSRL